MAQVVARLPALRQSNSSSSQSHSQSTDSTPRTMPPVVPNKHLPFCPPGPRPASERQSPPSTPPQMIEMSSLLHPPDKYPRIFTKPTVYGINARQLHDTLDHLAAQPLPDPKLMFPWLHGLHRDNAAQLAFVVARKRSARRIPRCMRSVTIVKVGGDLSHSKLKGAIAPNELLAAVAESAEPQFIESDPRDGFSARNFQIQASKIATVSDIVVYGDSSTSKGDVKEVAERVARAQKAWRLRDMESGSDRPTFSTFVLTDPFPSVEENHPEIVAIGANGCLTGNVMDFHHRERHEMHNMSAASAISPNVWLGPTPDAELEDFQTSASDDDQQLPYDFLIECNEAAQLPTKSSFDILEKLVEDPITEAAIPQLEFPGSGSLLPPTWSQVEIDRLMASIAWIYAQANGTSSTRRTSTAREVRKRKDSRLDIDEVDGDGDSIMGNSISAGTGRRFLIHCVDGYTETTLLALGYYMYAHGVPLHEAYLQLHKQHKRNFFAYQTDVALLTSIQPRILQASPALHNPSPTSLVPTAPSWMAKMDGSLPSRIMDYMYLGNLTHANNPALLKELGIGQILSVGENLDWDDEARGFFCADDPDRAWEYRNDNGGRYLYIGGVQDNGVDPLTIEFKRCLAFIRQGRARGTATLVHCRVGVSRSATICIAETMNELALSFPAAYCFVRARRLNVIIQPHLRFSYELLKYEEDVHSRRAAAKGSSHGTGPGAYKRELEWAWIAREIAAMNRPYTS